jgi:hypothetical protein
MTEIEANYIAGAVDGEGHITIIKHNYKEIYTINIGITNTNLSILKYIRITNKLGDIIKRLKRVENWKVTYAYVLRHYEYKKFLTPILPYLKIKKRQAELVLQYISLRRGCSEYPPTNEELKIRESIYEEIIPLNEKGQRYLHEVEIFPKLKGNLKELTENNCSYLAALVDGEGYLNIKTKINKNKSYSPEITITNTNIDLIHYIQMLTYSGYVCCSTSNSNWKNSYKWYLYYHQMKDFLIKIKPYLKIKDQQCNLLLEFLYVKGKEILTNHNKITIELIYDEIRNLNKRGV